MSNTKSDPIIEKFLSLKGQSLSLKYKRPLKTYKKLGPINLVKEVSMVCRAGCEYDNIKAVQEKRESGELPQENAGLPYGKWVVYKYLIEHNGGLQLRFSKFGNNPAKTRYLLDGKEISEKEATLLATANEFGPDDRETWNIKRENIVEIKSGN
jgi:hypothetical protein